MSDDATAARELVWREAAALDEQRWDDWLALYDETPVFWVPAWKSEHAPTADPENEISFIYIASRAQLEERVARVRSGRSAASTPMPRTAHAMTNLLVEPADGNAIVVRSVASTHLFDLRRRESHLYFARCEHILVRAAGELRIRQKKVLLLNDTLPTALDFYTV